MSRLNPAQSKEPGLANPQLEAAAPAEPSLDQPARGRLQTRAGSQPLWLFIRLRTFQKVIADPELARAEASVTPGGIQDPEHNIPVGLSRHQPSLCVPAERCLI